MKKALILGFVVILLAFLLVSLRFNAAHSDTSHLKSVGVSTFALYDIAKHLLPSDVDVFMVVPFGVDIHNFEPSPQDMVRIQKSALFFYSGAGLEPWSHAFVSQKHAIDMSQSVELLTMGKGHEEHEEHIHAHHGYDPHYWLSLKNMEALTLKMGTELKKTFPKLNQKIEKNSKSYIESLRQLYQENIKILKTCQKHEIVVNHNAFSYMGKDYGFRIHSLSGFSPDAMPSAAHMASLVSLVKDNNIQTIFFESFVSDKLMKSIAQESGVKVEVLQPLANISADDERSGATYNSLMRENIQKLAQAMECQ